MRNVINVTPFEFTIKCVMENGDIYNYDMSSIVKSNSPMTDPLKNIDFFKKVFIELGSLSWPNGYEIHANTIVRDGVLVAKEAG
jgi:hypothetical protein